VTTVCYFYSARFQPSLDAVRRYAPRATRVWTGPMRGPDPCLYAKKAAGFWGRDTMIYLEQDIVIGKNTVRDLARCPRDWCVFSYGVGHNGFPMRFGLGCTKFSLALQQQLPYQRVLTHNARNNRGRGGDCPACKTRTGIYCESCGDSACWQSQDTWIRHELMLLGITEPHVHGTVAHLHDYRIFPNLISDAGGFYDWDCASAF
jgi:hypothetical protein